VPALALGVALAAEQQRLAMAAARHQHQHRLGLGEAGEVPQVGILAVGEVRVPAADPLGGGRQHQDRVLAGHPHQLAAAARVRLGRDPGRRSHRRGHQFRRPRWRGPRAQSPCSSSAATRTYSSISASACSSSWSPPSSGMAAASRTRSASASAPSSDSGGAGPAARPKAPTKPRHHSNRAPLRAESGASGSGSSRSKPKAWSSICAAVARPRRSRTPPGATASRPSSAMTRAGQSGPAWPPPASQPHSPPCSSDPPQARPCSRPAASTSGSEGMDSDTYGSCLGSAQSRTCFPRLHAGMRPPQWTRRGRGLLPDAARAYTRPVTYASAGVRVSTNPGDLQLLVALLFIMLHRRRRERSYIEQLRDREERLKLALWATDERYWAYDVASGRIHRLAGESRNSPSGELAEESIDAAELVHPEDL